LPVEFVSVSAESKGDYVEVAWVTAMELNNDFFTIERSVDGSAWEAIGYVTGVGNSNELITYSFIDNNPLNGAAYYRIKQTDFDGSFDYSTVAMVRRTGEKLVAYPVPSQDWVTIRSNNVKSSDAIRVINIQGQDVTIHCSPVTMHGQLNLNLAELPNGVYMLHINGNVVRLVRG
jgi:hypothetical protein